MDLIDAIHQIMEQSMNAYGLTDLTIGTVTGVDPLEVKNREDMAPIPQSALRLTAAVIEKKIPVLTHLHITEGFRHNHTFSGLEHSHDVTGLGHSHSASEGETSSALDGSFGTSAALGGSFETKDGLVQDAFPSDERLDHIVCYEDGKPLPVEDGYIILNRALAVGDKVLLLKVMRSQQYIILSRVFERSEVDAAAV